VQLAQVSQAVHPSGSGCSVLEHLLGDAQTIPEDRGLFLERSWRMHPDVCRFVSEAFYEGGSSRRGVRAQATPRDRARGSSRSPTPGTAARRRRRRRRSARRPSAVGLDWTDAAGVTRPLEPPT
jgi:uncharacterized protein